MFFCGTVLLLIMGSIIVVSTSSVSHLEGGKRGCPAHTPAKTILSAEASSSLALKEVQDWKWLMHCLIEQWFPGLGTLRVKNGKE